MILLGPRRVGKTVMVHYAIERLLKEGVEPNRVMYLALDTSVYTRFSLERLTRSMAEMNRLEPGTTRYIFFDEIQYLKEWERHLKLLVDSYPSYRFIATGSATAALRLKSQESGAGPVYRFHAAAAHFR